MSNKRKSNKSDAEARKFFVGMAVMVVLLISVAVFLSTHMKALHRDAATQGSVPVHYTRAEDAMPFPPTLDPAGLQRSDFRAAYQVAKEIPGVLAQQPCYCFCQREGHRSLLDCYRTAHTTKCTICIKEALLTGQMHGQGKSPAEIRTAIIQGQWKNVPDS